MLSSFELVVNGGDVKSSLRITSSLALYVVFLVLSKRPPALDISLL